MCENCAFIQNSRERNVAERETCQLYSVWEQNSTSWWITDVCGPRICLKHRGCHPLLHAPMVEMKPAAGRDGCCRARIGSLLSEAVRGNSDWWKIRKTDCLGWWTAVSPRNLAISHPAELTIASTRRLLFQSRVVILPVSRLLVRCQLRAEASIAQSCRWRYVWNDMSFFKTGYWN